MRRRGLGALAVVVATALAGCTSIPSSSSPETIKPVELGNGQAPSVTPPPTDASPRDLVRDFLDASASAAAGSAQARAFLTGDARVRWAPLSKVTILDDSESISTYQQKTSEVVVRGRVIGTLNSAGIYTPNPQGSSPAGPYTYHLVKVRGQYRIDGLPTNGGLILTTDQFQQGFRQRSLYFYDLAGKYLVPDQRWTAATGVGLERWLITQLANGPRPELQTAVNGDTLPNQQVPSRLTVNAGTPTRIEIPGSSQLDSEARYRLAAQIGQTFEGVSASLEITDGGDPVPITSNTTVFTGSQFVDALGPTPPAPNVYFLRGGRIYGETNEELQGAVNSTSPPLSAIAMRQPSPSAALDVAALTGTGSARRLYIGSQFGGLIRTSIRGALSRPAWAPGLDEVWVGVGRGIMRVPVGPNGRPGVPIPVPLPQVAGATRVVALRFSPEGTRLALVIATATGTQQLFLGAIVRNAGAVRIDTLPPPISPPGFVITDVAWPQAMKLLAIGYNAASFDARIFETDVDGSVFNARPITGLPSAPDSVTAAPGQLAWVSADGAVWEQSGSSWQSPGDTGQRNGGAPVYLE